ncbi:unnamed protein product [Arctogadus glacialis]
MNPLKTLVPVNASRMKVVDKQIDVLVFSWRMAQLKKAGMVPLPQIRPQPTSPSLPVPLQWSDQPSNSLLPFYTALKPTFGCRFSWDTDHKIRSSGIDAKKP